MPLVFLKRIAPLPYTGYAANVTSVTPNRTAHELTAVLTVPAFSTGLPLKDAIPTRLLINTSDQCIQLAGPGVFQVPAWTIHGNANEK
jgi:hypothetical protein